MAYNNNPASKNSREIMAYAVKVYGDKVKRVFYGYSYVNGLARQWHAEMEAPDGTRVDIALGKTANAAVETLLKREQETEAGFVEPALPEYQAVAISNALTLKFERFSKMLRIKDGNGVVIYEQLGGAKHLWVKTFLAGFRVGYQATSAYPATPRGGKVLQRTTPGGTEYVIFEADFKDDPQPAGLANVWAYGYQQGIEQRTSALRSGRRPVMHP